MKRLNAGIIGLLLFFVCATAYATLSATIPTRHNFVGNDVATSFSYTVEISDQDHIKLVHTDTAGVENALADPLVVDVDYTVNGVGNAGGGSVDFPKAGSVYSTLATGEKLSIIYDFPLEQTTDIPNTGRVFNESIEDQLDYMTILTNQLKEKLDRSIILPEGSTLTDIFFPEGTSATNRASKIAAWDSAGTALELLAVASAANVDPIAVKGDIAQGDASGDAAKLAIGGTGAILSVVSGLLDYTAIGSASDVLQVVAGVPAWVTNPILLIPTIADLTNATHDHADAAGGGTVAPTNYRSGFECAQTGTDTMTVKGGVVEADGTVIYKTSDTTLTLGTGTDWVDDTSDQATSTYGYVYINSTGKIEMDNIAPDSADVSDNTSGVLRYNNTGTDTSWRRMLGWFYMNATGSGELSTYEVGNLKDGDVDNSVVRTDSTQDTIDDTAAGTDLTNTVINFYTSGRGTVEIQCNVLFSNVNAAGREVHVAIDDGSLVVPSESATIVHATGGNYSLIPTHKETYAQGTFTFTAVATVDAGDATAEEKTMMIKEN